MLVAKEGEMEKRKVQEAVAEWQAEKRRRVEDGEEVDGDDDDDDEDVQDVQVRLSFFSLCSAHYHGAAATKINKSKTAKHGAGGKRASGRHSRGGRGWGWIIFNKKERPALARRKKFSTY